MKKELGIIGLGKMGSNLAQQLLEKHWRIVGYNRTAEVTKNLESKGLTGAYSLKEIVSKLSPPRVIWLMLPAGAVVDDHLFGKSGLVHYLEAGDIVIDGGNSFFADAKPRSQKLAKKEIKFMDVGTSGGPGGARHGACLMIGGDEHTYRFLEPLFKDCSKPKAYQFFEGIGAGHFVKMVHNGIEYGMMQALAEGFTVLKQSNYNLNLIDVTRIYNTGSVVESRLTQWLLQAFQKHGQELNPVSGTVRHTGEGEWTIKTAKELKIPVPIIKNSFQFRIDSEKNPSYTGQVLSALRGEFGGHAIQ